MIMDEKIKNEELEEYIQQAKTLLDAGAYEDAAIYAQKALELDGRNFEAFMINGMAQADMEQWEQAIECFRKAQMLDTKAAAPYYHKGMIYFMTGDNEAGIKECNMAIELGFDKPEIYFNLGLVYEGMGEFQPAVRYYTRAIKCDMLNPYPYVCKAMVYLNQMKYEEGLEVLGELRKYCPDCFEGYHFAAAAYCSMGEYEKADTILAKAEELFEEDVDILNDRIKLLVAQEKYKEAEEKLKKAQILEKDPLQNKQLILSRAKICGLKGNMEESICLMEEALHSGKQEDMDSEIRYLLIHAFLPNKEYQKILEQAEELRALPETLPFALGAAYFKAFALSHLKEDRKTEVYKEAICYYRNLTIRKPSVLEAYLFRSICHKELGELDKALELIEYVEKLTSSFPKLMLIKAGVLQEMGRKDEALKLLEQPELAGEDLLDYLLNQTH